MSKRTTYVIGAGASAEAGLPVGSQLKDNIKELLNITFDYHQQMSGDRIIVNALGKICPNTPSDPLQNYIDSAWEIRDALPLAISIDNFLDSRKGDRKIELCGKLGIVRSILQAEKDSRLYIERERSHLPLDINTVEDKWYLSFFKLLVENCTITDLPERFSNISLIIFNYDRCVQHYLYHTLQIYYKISEAEASKLVLSLNIIHPYGSVGALPWKNIEIGQQITFGCEPSGAQLLELAKRIRTFTEGVSPDSGDIDSVRNTINMTHRLVFIGFAFHKLNMRLIEPSIDNNKLKIEKCFASTFGISESDRASITNLLSAKYNQDPLGGATSFVHTKACSCKDFFDEFRLGLSF